MVDQCPKVLCCVGGRCICRFLYYNGHICSRKPRNKVRAPREKNPSHHGVGWVHWGARRRFMVVPTTVPLHAIATAVAMVIVFKVSARVKVLTKRGAKASLDWRGSPFPFDYAPQIWGRVRIRKPKSLHCDAAAASFVLHGCNMIETRDRRGW